HHAGWVDGAAAPVRPSAREREDERALQRRRRVEAFIAQARDPVATRRSVEESEAECILLPQLRWDQRRHVDGKRLRRRQLLALRAALRHRALFDRVDRLAGVAVQDEDEALLG